MNALKLGPLVNLKVYFPETKELGIVTEVSEDVEWIEQVVPGTEQYDFNERMYKMDIIYTPRSKWIRVKRQASEVIEKFILKDAVYRKATTKENEDGELVELNTVRKDSEVLGLLEVD